MYPLLVTAAIISRDGDILLTRRPSDVPHAGLWEFPGGKLEPQEDPRECVVREVREELGIEVAVDGIYEVVYHRYPERTVLIMAYRCRWTGGMIENLGVADHCWVPPERLAEFPLLPADYPLARRLAEELGNAGESTLHRR